MVLPVVDLVIVHRDQADAVLATVREFRAQDGVALRIVVVDNGSAPEAREQVRDGLPDGVEWLPLGTNTGFGPGANAGLRWCLAHDPSPWLAVCPHDARPLPGCLARLVAVTAAQDRGGPRLRRRGRQPHAGGRPLLRRHPCRRHRGRRLGALRLPPRHAHGGPARLPRAGRSVRRALLRLLRGGRAGHPGQGRGVAGRCRPGRRRPQPARRLASRGRRLPAAPQHAADGEGALRAVPRLDPAGHRAVAAGGGGGRPRPARPLLGAPRPGAGHRRLPARALRPAPARAVRAVRAGTGAGARERSRTRPDSAASISGRTRSR